MIGIGVNCRLPDALRERIDQPVTDLAQIAGAAVDRNRLLAMLLIDLAEVLDEFAQAGFAPLRDEWQRSHVYQGQPVRLTLPDAGTHRRRGERRRRRRRPAARNGQRRARGSTAATSA